MGKLALDRHLHWPNARRRNVHRDTVLPIRDDWPLRPSATQFGVTVRSEKKDSLPMSTNRPILPADGAALVSVSVRPPFR
jgi:hypothetical protein